MDKEVPMYLYDLSNDELKLIFNYRNSDNEKQKEILEAAEKTEKSQTEN